MNETNILKAIDALGALIDQKDNEINLLQWEIAGLKNKLEEIEGGKKHNEK